MRGYGDCAGGRQEEEVPVRLPARDIFRADRAVGAGPVLHDDALSQERLELVGKEAANEVGRPARGKRDHDAHGPGGEILGSGRGREHWGSEPRREKGGGGGSSQPDHEAPLPFGPGQSSAFPIGAAGPTLRESSTTERRRSSVSLSIAAVAGIRELGPRRSGGHRCLKAGCSRWLSRTTARQWKGCREAALLVSHKGGPSCFAQKR